MVALTGYHGTLSSNAYSIIKTQSFFHSVGDDEWLGPGIYFFLDFELARRWSEYTRHKEHRESEEAVVVKADIFCADDRYLDLDDNKILSQMESEFKEVLKASKLEITFDNPDKRKCAACKYYAEKHNISVISFTFYRKIRYKVIGFESYIPERQICVLDDNAIDNISCVSGVSHNDSV